MRKACVFVAALAAGVWPGGPAHGQGPVTVTYRCDIGGAPAQLTAQVQAVSPAGVFLDSAGRFGGSIATGEVNYHYQGTLISATGRYAFTGENQFADFVDLNTNDRFRVQMIAQGAMLLMIVNPQGPGPVQYLCQMAGRP
jgi:hypothetical protein